MSKVGPRRAWDWRARGAEFAIFSLLYMVVARLSILTLKEDGIAVVWPATGLSLGYLLLRGRWLWPGIFLGASAANLLAGFPTLWGIALAATNAAETLLAIFVLGKLVDFHPSLDRLQDVASLGLVSMGATIVGAGAAALASLLVGTSVGATPWNIALTWWTADQTSIWLLTPALLVVALARPLPLRWRYLLELLLALGGLALLSWQIFVTPFYQELSGYTFYLLPFLVWLALRTGPFGTVLGNLLMGMMTVGGTLLGRGLFGHEGHEPTLAVQTFLIVSPLTGLVLAITTAERQREAARAAWNERRLEATLEAARAATWDWDALHDQTLRSRGYNALFGEPPEMNDWGLDGFMRHVHPDDRARLAAEISQAQQEQSRYEPEFRVLWPDGSLHWLSVRGSPRMKGGQCIGLGGLLLDITRIKQAESLLQERGRRLIQLNEELVRSNADLEQFAYVASHDLREPIRMMASFGELLQQRYGGQLDERGRKYLGYVVEGALRLQALVRDLLAYSRVGQSNLLPEPTNFNEVVRRVQSALRQAISEAQARLTVTSLPTLQALPSQMDVLFQNLVENALKFRRAQPPEISISATEGPTEWEFELKDNGIGIEPQYLGRIFGLFQRLHGREEYPGTGMGLAICKRIVERHGGRIWATSRPGVGTCIHFTLPRQPAVVSHERPYHEPVH